MHQHKRFNIILGCRILCCSLIYNRILRCLKCKILILLINLLRCLIKILIAGRYVGKILGQGWSSSWG